MWNKYNNKIAFCLLTDKQKAKIKTHKGHLLVLRDDGWFRVSNPMFRKELVYRARRTPWYRYVNSDGEYVVRSLIKLFSK